MDYERAAQQQMKEEEYPEKRGYTDRGRLERAVPPPTPPMRDKPRLLSVFEQINCVVAECHQIVGIIENATERLIIPREGAGIAGTSAPTPAAPSLEQRMCETLKLAEALRHRLHASSEKLDSAV